MTKRGTAAVSDEGLIAHADGLPSTANPYTFTDASDKAVLWEAGWLRAEAQRVREDVRVTRGAALIKRLRRHT